MAYYHISLGPWAWTSLLFFALLILFTVGVTFATSAIDVFYRDVNPVVQIGLQLWLYLTPVAYSLSAAPTRFRLFFMLNPLSAIVEGFRSAVVFGRAPDWQLTAISSSIILCVFAIAFVMFKRMDKYFADVI
jgi:lipopolysaccharide transport system permease protein